MIQDDTFKVVWEDSMCDEIGRLAQGRNKTGLKGTNTTHFIPYVNIPQNRRQDITYPRIAVDYRPQKEEPNRTRITVGGNQINYPYNVTTQTAEILGSTSLSTLHKAIRKGYLKSWPGLTTTNVTQHIQFKDATMKGHLDHVRKNLRSTTTTNTECKEIEAEHKTHFAFAAVKEIGKIYTDQTGAFPVLSSRGHRYIFILYHYDTNAILTEPLKNRTANEIHRAHANLVQYLQQRGYSPTMHWLDNEASQLIKNYDTSEK